MKKQKTARSLILRVLVIVIVLLFIGVILGIGSVLSVQRHATKSIDGYTADYPAVNISKDPDGCVTVYPKSFANHTGIVLYTGAQIDPEAYIPLCVRLAEYGYFCAIPVFTRNIAPFNPGKATEFLEQELNIDQWYIAGHSLGGVTAAGFAARQSDDIAGLVLLASYSTHNLSGTPVLSIFGDRDGVLNMDRYKKSILLYGSGFTEHVIRGGNHAQFGDYGPQPKDSPAEISPDAQWTETAATISEWISSQT